VPFEAQCWAGTFFATNVADNGTATAKDNIGNLNSGDTTATAVTGPLSGGARASASCAAVMSRFIPGKTPINRWNDVTD
jgi:hypothetical protein